MKKLFIFPIALVAFLWVSLATPSLELLTSLSSQIIEQSTEKNHILSLLKNIFTSCAETNKNSETKTICKSFLETSFPSLKTKYWETISWQWSTISSPEKCFRIDYPKILENNIIVTWWDGTTSITTGNERIIKGEPTGINSSYMCHSYFWSQQYKVSLTHPEEITELTIIGQNLSTFDLSSAKNLKGLSLGENSIKKLENWIFKWLNKLETLYLWKSELVLIESEVFKDIKSLKYLNLWDNELVTLDPQRIEDLFQLTYLSIAENNINYINPDIFSSLKHLEYLDIGGNPFWVLSRSYFQGLEYMPDIIEEEGITPYSPFNS